MGLGLVNDADLLSALAANRLSGACFDVFEVEPLSADHPFRFHPKITVTPPYRREPVAEQQAAYAARAIACRPRSEMPAGVVDFHACY
jgi:glyoxylate/hydroxypyruvate reductase A